MIRPSRKTGKTRVGAIGELRLGMIYLVCYQGLDEVDRQAALVKKPGRTRLFA